MTIKLIDPVAGTILQTFGGDPETYAQFGLIGHNGIDYGCPVGTPVFAAAAGQVTKIQTDPDGYGLHIRIQHPNGTSPEYRTIYAHLSEVNVKLNQKVAQGEVIAKSGNSGFSTTPHVHFELRPEPQQDNGYNGAVDPVPYFSQPEATETPATDPTAEPTTNKAIVVWSSLNMRPETNTTTPAVGLLYAGFEIKYDAIIEMTGGDGELEKWLACNLWGRTIYFAAYYGGDWSVSLS
jgi:hypothetical protein